MTTYNTDDAEENVLRAFARKYLLHWNLYMAMCIFHFFLYQLCYDEIKNKEKNKEI